MTTDSIIFHLSNVCRQYIEKHLSFHLSFWRINHSDCINAYTLTTTAIVQFPLEPIRFHVHIGITKTCWGVLPFSQVLTGSGLASWSPCRWFCGFAWGGYLWVAHPAVHLYGWTVRQANVALDAFLVIARKPMWKQQTRAFDPILIASLYTRFLQNERHIL